MFRVYDTEKHQWLKDNIYLSPDGELYKIKQGILGLTKVPLALDGERYIYHRAIDLYDKNRKQVCEGDYIQAQVAEDKSVVGLVVFAAELSSWVILCVDSDEFYTLGSSVSTEIQVIGNVFDGYKEVNNNDESALSKTKDKEGKVY